MIRAFVSNLIVVVDPGCIDVAHDGCDALERNIGNELAAALPFVPQALDFIRRSLQPEI